jgi:hypothetical protein
MAVTKEIRMMKPRSERDLCGRISTFRSSISLIGPGLSWRALGSEPGNART